MQTNYNISQNVEADPMTLDSAVSRHIAFTTLNNSFIDETNNVTVNVRSYNQHNKFRHLTAFTNANTNKYKQELIKKGGDTRKRLQQKLLMQKLEKSV